MQFTPSFTNKLIQHISQTHLNKLVGLLSIQLVGKAEGVWSICLVEVAQQLSKVCVDIILTILGFQTLQTAGEDMRVKTH